MPSAWPYVKQTWNDGPGGGTPKSAARLAYIEQGISDAILPPVVEATHNTTQSIANATNTNVAFNTEAVDQAGGSAAAMHDTVTNNSRLTALYAGYYLIFFTVVYTGNVAGMRYAWIEKNASAAIRYGVSAVVGNGTENDMTIVAGVAMAVNDYVQAVLHQTSGAALNIGAGLGTPRFGMVRVA